MTHTRIRALRCPDSSSAGPDGREVSRDDRTSDALSGHLAEDIDSIRSVIGASGDVVFRPFELFDGRPAYLVYISGLSDEQQIDSDIFKPLTKGGTTVHSYTANAPADLRTIGDAFVTAGSTEQVATLEEALHHVVVGLQVLLLVDGEPHGLAISIGGGEQRGVEEPETEAVIRGPREGFTEDLRTSITLLRRRIRSTELVVEFRTIGRYTQTKVALCFLRDIINPSLVDEMRQRLDRIDIDAIIDSGYLEELVEDNAFSPFPQLQNTERPDVVASALLEGRLALISEGSPFALIAPIDLWGALQAAEDYYERYPIVNLIRWLRYLFMGIALYLPSLYVAITTFHQEMLPTKLLISIAAAREVTPFPALVECLLMEVTFEALREAGVRLPKTVGSAISIVGALVIGQSAVEAGIVSAPMVIVVAITGIASFVIPRFSFAIAIRMLRFAMILAGGLIGVFGIVMLTVAVVIHLSSLRSLGVPYLQPVSPFSRSSTGDVVLRAPQWAMRRRPEQTSRQNVRRQSAAMAPDQRVPRSKRNT